MVAVVVVVVVVVVAVVVVGWCYISYIPSSLMNESKHFKTDTKLKSQSKGVAVE